MNVMPATTGNGFHFVHDPLAKVELDPEPEEENPIRKIGASGAEIMAEVIKDPTIDLYLDRNPKINTDQDYEDMVAMLKRQRTMYITADANKRAGVKKTEETENETDTEES